MFEFLAIAAAVVSAGSQVAGGIGARKSADLNAENIKTQRIMNEAAAMQRANDRHDQFKFAESANRALLSGAMGRDISGADRSVAAFLRRNRETAFSDIGRIEDQTQMESLNLDLQAASERRRGREAQISGIIGAFTTMAGAYDSYDRTRFSPKPTAFAPTSSPRPTLRPR